MKNTSHEKGYVPIASNAKATTHMPLIEAACAPFNLALKSFEFVVFFPLSTT